MLVGKCPYCGFSRCGWALQSPRYKSCPRCGKEFQIEYGYDTIFEDSSSLSLDYDVFDQTDDDNYPE